MLYHNLINSSDDRLAKRLILQQINEEDDDSFYETVKQMLRSLKIDIKDVEQMSKAELKKKVKERIGENMVINFEELQMKKLRFISDPVVFQRRKYLEVMDGKTAVKVLKMRLNMMEVYGNFKGNLYLERLCPLCQKEEDTTEHLITCYAINQNKITPAHLSNEDNIMEADN